MRTAGTDPLTAHASSVSDSNQGNISVSPAATSTFTVVPSPNPVTAGASFNVTVTAKDAFGNTTPSYGGTGHFSNPRGPNSPPPAPYHFVLGESSAHPFCCVILKN